MASYIQKENCQLREAHAYLTKKIKECEEQRKKRFHVIQELRNAKDVSVKTVLPTEPAVAVNVVSPTSAAVEMKQDTLTDFKYRHTPSQPSWCIADPAIAAQARANTESRSHVSNPCRFARYGMHF